MTVDEIKQEIYKIMTREIQASEQDQETSTFIEWLDRLRTELMDVFDNAEEIKVEDFI